MDFTQNTYGPITEADFTDVLKEIEGGSVVLVTSGSLAKNFILSEIDDIRAIAMSLNEIQEQYKYRDVLNCFDFTSVERNQKFRFVYNYGEGDFYGDSSSIEYPEDIEWYTA